MRTITPSPRNIDKDTYPFRQPGEVRWMYETQPSSVSGMS